MAQGQQLPSDKVIEIHLNDPLPLFKKKQEVFDQEIAECDKQKVIEMGLGEGQQFETQEAHIRDATTSKKLIPTKGSVKEEWYDVEGYTPWSPGYQVFNLQEPRHNIIYDITARDYDFLDHTEVKVAEDHFEYLMTVFDLMFPTKYRNIRVPTNSHAFQQVYQAMQEISKAPQRYLLGFTPEEVKGITRECAEAVFEHFCDARDRTRQPLVPHLSAETTRRDKDVYFKPAGDKKPGKFNSNKMRQYMNIYALYNMLGEYVLARELLNAYSQSLKYVDGLLLIDQRQPGRAAEQLELLPAPGTLPAQLEHYLRHHRLEIPGVQISPVYQVQTTFKPYLSSEQLRKQHERCMENYKDVFKPARDTRGTIQSVKKETNEFLQFYNEVMDYIEEGQ